MYNCLYTYNNVCYQCIEGYKYFSGAPACTTNLTGRLYYNGMVYDTCPGGTYENSVGSHCYDDGSHKYITLAKNEYLKPL